MAHSLEYRAPFLDHRLIDFSFTLPDSQKIHGGTDKYLWRQLAARHLSKEITHRPKQPFYIPLEHAVWRRSLIAIARDLLTPESLSKHNFFDYDAIKPLFGATEFLPLKQLASLIIIQGWLEKD